MAQDWSQSPLHYQDPADAARQGMPPQGQYPPQGYPPQAQYPPNMAGYPAPAMQGAPMGAPMPGAMLGNPGYQQVGSVPGHPGQIQLTLNLGPGGVPMGPAATQMQAAYRGMMVRRQLSSEGKMVRTPGGAYMPGKQPRPLWKPNANYGTMVIQLQGGKGLHDPQCCFSMDPYIRLSVGVQQLTSEHISGGGVKPQWPNHPTFHMAIRNHKSVLVECMNHNLFCDDEVGRVNLEVGKIQKKMNDEAKRESFQLTREGSKRKAGELFMTVRYLPPIILWVDRCEGLHDVQTVGKQDPFVRVTYVGKLAEGETGVWQSRVARDGHTKPVWKASAAFCVTDERQFDEKEAPGVEDIVFRIEVINENHMVNDYIAYTEATFGDLWRRKFGQHGTDSGGGQKRANATGFQLYKGSAKKGGKEPAGQVFVGLDEK